MSTRTPKLTQSRAKVVGNKTASAKVARRVADAPVAVKTAKAAKERDPILDLATLEQWDRWLSKNYASSRGVLLLIRKKLQSQAQFGYPEALDVALAWGWIDSVKWAHDEQAWLQRFSPRTSRSPWSKINRDKVEVLIAAGKMQAPGLLEVTRAKADGRWARAYDSARSAEVPADLAEALAAAPRAAAFFKTIDGANRYAILYRLQTAKKPETRSKRLKQFIAMLSQQETIHPARKPRP